MLDVSLGQRPALPATLGDYMTKHLNALPIQSGIDFSTYDNGELIVFGFKIGEKNKEAFQEVHFVVHSDVLPLLIAKFQEIGAHSDELKAKNPLRAGSNFGYAYRLEKAAIGPSGKRQGEHILEVESRSSGGGTSKYRLRTDRAGLENLCDLIRQYLDGPDSQNPKAGQPH